MIEHRTGDLLRADAEALVNPVNCAGVMGKGLAAQFERAFPESFRSYRTACLRGDVAPGRMHVFETGCPSSPRYIVHFPTKRHWRDKSRIEDVDAGLIALVDEVRRRGIRSIAVPPLGCGLGGLEWEHVPPRIEAAFAGLPATRVLVFQPTAGGGG